MIIKGILPNLKRIKSLGVLDDDSEMAVDASIDIITNLDLIVENAYKKGYLDAQTDVIRMFKNSGDEKKKAENIVAQWRRFKHKGGDE